VAALFSEPGVLLGVLNGYWALPAAGSYEGNDQVVRQASKKMSESSSPSSESTVYTRYLLGMIVVVMMLSTVDRYIVSILVDDIKADLSLTDRQMGWILGPSFTLIYALSVLPLARWADRGVRRTIIAAGLTVWSLFTMSTAWVQGYAQLLVMRMGVGVGEASAGPAIQSLISDTVPPEGRSRGLSFISMGAVLGIAVGMAGGGWLNELWGWRIAFLVAGAPGLVVALLFRFTIREPARGAIEGRSESQEKKGSLLEDCRYLLSLPSMRWLLVAHGFALLYTSGKGAWEPTFIRRVYDMGSGSAGTWYFLTTPIPSIFGLFLGGWLCDRWSQRDRRAHLWVPILSLVGSLPFMILFLVWPAEHRVPLPGGLPAFPVAFGFSVVSSIIGAMHSAPFLAAVQGLAKLRMRASAAALFSLTGSGIGSGLGPVIIGELNVRFADTYGDEAIRWGLVWLSFGFVLAAIACGFAARGIRDDLDRTKRESVEDANASGA
jgi:MFS family permease